MTENDLRHGLSKTRLFVIWQGMKQRCFYKKAREFHNYGGRGITICDEWKNDFLNFYNWAKMNGYKTGLTIDRIDVNGNYTDEILCGERIRSKNSKKIILLSENKVFDSLKDASIETKLSTSFICSILKGKKKSKKGFVFKYL